MTAETFLGPAPNDLASRRRSSNIRSYTEAENKEKKKGSLSLSAVCWIRKQLDLSTTWLDGDVFILSLSLSCL